MRDQSGFIGSFDAPWSEWSRIRNGPDPDHRKGTYFTLCQCYHLAPMGCTGPFMEGVATNFTKQEVGFKHGAPSSSSSTTLIALFCSESTFAGTNSVYCGPTAGQ